MASAVALRMIGEAEEIPPSSSSIAHDWFNGLSDTAREWVTSGGVKHLEIEAVSLLMPDANVATWEEFTAGASGDVSTVHFEGVPITCFSVYVRHKAFDVSDELAIHVSDHKTHKEAEKVANDLAAELGVRVVDFAIAADGSVFEHEFDDEFITGLVNRSLRPYLKIDFLDGDKEEIMIPLKWIKQGYSVGSSDFPALVPRPTRAQLRQIGGPIGKLHGGEYAMEVIYSNRYEGDERSGVLHDDPAELASTAEEVPDLYFRPLRFEFCNEDEPPDVIPA